MSLGLVLLSLQDLRKAPFATAKWRVAALTGWVQGAQLLSSIQSKSENLAFLRSPPASSSDHAVGATPDDTDPIKDERRGSPSEHESTSDSDADTDGKPGDSSSENEMDSGDGIRHDPSSVNGLADNSAIGGRHSDHIDTDVTDLSVADDAVSSRMRAAIGSFWDVFCHTKCLFNQSVRTCHHVESRQLSTKLGQLTTKNPPRHRNDQRARRGKNWGSYAPPHASFCASISLSAR